MRQKQSGKNCVQHRVDTAKMGSDTFKVGQGENNEGQLESRIVTQQQQQQKKKQAGKREQEVKV